MQLSPSRWTMLTDRLETVFKFLFFLYAAMSFNCVTFGKWPISLVMWPTFALGGLLILNRVCFLKRYRTPHMWWLVALLAAACVSLVCNLGYDLRMNILYIITWAFYFLLLYVQPHDRQTTSLKKELHGWAIVYTAFTEICVIVSIVMLFTGYSVRVDFEGGRMLAGFVDRRLYGMFIDPNAGATCAAISVLFMVYALRLYRRIWQRVLLIVGVVLNLFYVALSDSRTGMVVLLVISFIYTLLYLIHIWKHRRLMPLFALVGATIIGVGCFCAPTLLKKGYNATIAAWTIAQAEKEADETSDPLTEAEKQALINSMTVHRDYDLSGDISNRRFSIWQSGFEIFLKRPLVGTTYAGFTDFAREHLPETYIVNNDYMDMNTFDNEIVNTMVSSGIIGLIPLLVFAFGILLFLIRRVGEFEHEHTVMTVAMAFAAVCGIAASAMFRSAILYYVSSNSVLFWALLGLLSMLCITKNRGDVSEN